MGQSLERRLPTTPSAPPGTFFLDSRGSKKLTWLDTASISVTTESFGLIQAETRLSSVHVPPLKGGARSQNPQLLGGNLCRSAQAQGRSRQPMEGQGPDSGRRGSGWGANLCIFRPALL